jgi:hypothetical protein
MPMNIPLSCPSFSGHPVRAYLLILLSSLHLVDFLESTNYFELFFLQPCVRQLYIHLLP